jgi:CheY-like chemotaxis protein
MRLSICIIDEDALRAETIKETLLDEDYQVESFTSEDTGLRAIVEKGYDIIFVALEHLNNTLDYVNKLRNLSPLSGIVALTAGNSADKILPLSELGVKHYIETPINSINMIIGEVAKIEADIMKTEQKKELFTSILEETKALLKGKIPTESAKTKELAKKLDLAMTIFSSAINAPAQLKGNLEQIPLHDIIRIAACIYKEGMLEITNGNTKAVMIMKNKIVVHCGVAPSLQGMKAFSRIAGWEKGSFIFKNQQVPTDYQTDAELAVTDIDVLCAEANRTRNWFAKKRKNLPPDSLVLSVNVRLLEKNPHMEFTPVELELLANVIQYKNIKAITDFCRLSDTMIFDTLIALRKRGALEVKP